MKRYKLGERLPLECGCGVKRKTRNTRVYPVYQPQELGYKIRYCLVCLGKFKTGMKQDYDTSEKTRSYTTKYRRYKDGQKEIVAA
tara:strand:+ start:321 stop:575 length:255 start_codon:yes stop_codon:yes gene_type:complete